VPTVSRFACYQLGQIQGETSCSSDQVGGDKLYLSSSVSMR